MTAPVQVRAGDVLWTPPADARTATEIGRFMTWVERRHGLSFAGYDDLWAWSVEHLASFWTAVADYMPVHFTTPPRSVLSGDRMPDVTWFDGATLNYAEHVLAGADEDVVLIAHSESRPRLALTRGDLRRQVGAVQQFLRAQGIVAGDRVAAYLPNIPETFVVLLACASIGAVFTSCAPESGTASVLSKIRQVEPRVLFAVDGYVYGGRPFPRHAEVEAIRTAVPSIELVVEVPYLDPDGERLPESTDWRTFASNGRDPDFAAVPFQHPLYIVYSSGTTGTPKAIVHGHGGILLEHLKLFRLHDDLGPGDRWLWYSSTNWMAWNFGVSVLATGAAVVTLDGHPMKPDLRRLWQLVGEERVTFLGTSPSFLGLCQKAGLRPAEVADLTALRAVNAGGSPLAAEGWAWIQHAVKPGVYISSGSGGTDVASSFVGGSRLLPVRAGEIACRLLGVDAQAYDESGAPVVGQRGELVIRRPMPSMPVCFWGDDGHRLREAYFEQIPGVWCHGDWVSFSSYGSCVVTGRSDATLNRGGVRLGTGEFYSVLDDVEGLADSMVVHLEDGRGGSGQLILFVVPTAGAELSEQLTSVINESLRRELSPRHVPDRIIRVAAIPRTLSGKRMEVPVKRLLLDPDLAITQDAASTDADLSEYRSLARSLTVAAEAGSSPR